jgi:hypothetical protein
MRATLPSAANRTVLQPSRSALRHPPSASAAKPAQAAPSPLALWWGAAKMFCPCASNEAVIEWTHWKRKTRTAQRGDEWYVFDDASGLIKKIRAYYAAPAVKDIPIGELVEFDYKGSGYHLTHE